MIRKLLPSDREIYLELSRQFYSSDAVDHCVPIAFIETAFDEMLKPDGVLQGYVFEQQGEVVGYFQTAKTFSAEAGGRVLWLEEAYLLPNARGNGLGTKMLEFIKNYCAENGYARIRLEVSPNDGRAKQLYLRTGFKPLDYEQLVIELR